MFERKLDKFSFQYKFSSVVIFLIYKNNLSKFTLSKKKVDKFSIINLY